MNRRDFLKAAGTAAAGLAIPKLPRIQGEKKIPKENDEIKAIFEYTEEEELLMYRFCACGEKYMRLENDTVVCIECGKSRHGKADSVIIDSVRSWLYQCPKAKISISSLQTPITRVIRMAQWEKFRAHHMVRGTFNEQAQPAYKSAKRLFSEV